jgi:isoleucyl-tRNA synthetase
MPGWDCHGLPIEWKIEEQYRAKGKNKDEVPVNEFRANAAPSPMNGSACSAGVQAPRRLGDWDNYT